MRRFFLAQGLSVPGVGPEGAVACPSGGGYDLISLQSGQRISSVDLRTAQQGSGVHIVNPDDPRCRAGATAQAPAPAVAAPGAPIPAAAATPAAGRLPGVRRDIMARFGAPAAFEAPGMRALPVAAPPFAAPVPRAVPLAPAAPACPDVVAILEAANLLALNLANDIVTGARTAEEARANYELAMTELTRGVL